MKNRRMLLIVLSLLTVLALALSACGGATTETAATEVPAAEPTEVVVEEPTEAPAEEPTVAPTEEVAEEPTEAPAEEPTEEASTEGEQPFAGEELVIGLMTDKSGALAIYGPSQTQGFYLGLEYATEGTMEVAGRPIRVVEMG